MRDPENARRDAAEGLSLRLRSAMRDEAARLLAKLATTPQHGAFMAALDSHLPIHPFEPDDPIDDLTGFKDRYPLAALLLHGPIPSSPAIARLDHLRAWVTGTTLVFMATKGLDDSDHVPLRAARFARRLCTTRNPVAARLPALDGDLSDVITALEDFEEVLERESAASSPVAQTASALDAEAGGPVQFHRRVGDVLALLGACQSDKLRRGGRRSRRGPPVEEIPVGGDPLRRRRGRVELGGFNPTRIARTVAIDGQHIATREEVGDLDDVLVIDPGVIDLDSGEFGENLSFFERGLLERSHVARLFAAPTAAMTESAALTPGEALRLLDAGRRALKSRMRPAPPGAVLCLAALFFGRSVSELATADRDCAAPGKSFWIQADGYPALAYAPDVTGSRSEVSRGSRNVFAVQLPPLIREHFQPVIHALPSAKAAEEMARAWLREANISNRPPRLERVERFLSDALGARDADSAVTSLLAGEGVEDCPALYYATTPIHVLDSASRDYRERTLRLGPTDGPVVISPSGAPTVGTFRAPSVDEVREHVARLADRVGAARFRVWTGDRIATFHGAYMDYVGSILVFATARRPHGPAFDHLSGLVGRNRPRVLVSDKENRAVNASRWIPLPAIIMEQLAALRRHMEMVAERFAIEAPTVAQAARTSSSGEGPPLFLIADWFEGAPRIALPRSAVSLHERAGHPGSRKPRNWCRHFMRGALTARNVPGRLVDAYMGHGGSQTNPYRTTSGATMADLEPLRDVIGALCVEVGFRSLEGLQ